MGEHEQQVVSFVLQRLTQALKSNTSVSVSSEPVVGNVASNNTTVGSLNVFVIITGNALGENIQNTNQSPESKQNQK